MQVGALDNLQTGTHLSLWAVVQITKKSVLSLGKLLSNKQSRINLDYLFW